MLGLAFEICPSGVDEKAVRDNNPTELTRKLAEAKARKVASEYPHAVVVSGDAVVSNGANDSGRGDCHQSERGKLGTL
jgi:septum formation protein